MYENNLEIMGDFARALDAVQRVPDEVAGKKELLDLLQRYEQHLQDPTSLRSAYRKSLQQLLTHFANGEDAITASRHCDDFAEDAIKHARDVGLPLGERELEFLGHVVVAKTQSLRGALTSVMKEMREQREAPDPTALPSLNKPKKNNPN